MPVVIRPDADTLIRHTPLRTGYAEAGDGQLFSVTDAIQVTWWGGLVRRYALPTLLLITTRGAEKNTTLA